MLKILISGYTGFIGSNLTNKLCNNVLFGVDIFEKNTVAQHFGWDSLNECTDINCIIHLAGKAHDTKNTATDQEYFDINVGLTQKIFQHFLNSSATKFIFFSSVKAVADSVTGDLLTEDAIPNPQTAYGRSKLEAEKYILNEWAKWRECENENNGAFIDKKVFILRPCMIHGPGNKGNLNLLFKLQQKGLPWPLGTFDNKRSFCSVDNILFVIQQLIDRDIESGIYQVADDDTLSTNELIQLMAFSQNKKAKIWHIPARLIRAFARVGDILHLPLNSERLRKLTESYLVSNQKIKNALGIDKMPVSSDIGLKKTFDSFNKNL